jgi:outer membrane receptor for ferrienterochelin and colicin
MEIANLVFQNNFFKKYVDRCFNERELKYKTTTKKQEVIIMKVKISILLFTLLILTLGKSILYAGTTGKIAGVVTDAETGDALPGVNIVISGTAMGAATDMDGYYIILNVPPGLHNVTFSMIGYREVRYENVRVSIDLTTTINAALQTEAVELGEAVVVTAQRELILKDMTSSLAVTSAEEIESLPVQTIQEVLRLNAGIIESNGRLHIRGGRPGEVAYWVNGISATDVYDGRIGVTVENTAVQELQVISGTFNAEYGQAMSGIVNIITKEGGKKYSGQIEAYMGDYVSNDPRFHSFKALETESDPNSGLTRVVSSQTEEPLRSFNPIVNGEFSLSGPVPFLGNKLSFFTTGRYFYDEGYYYGVEWFKPNGTPGSNAVVAMNPLERISLQGKLSYQLSSVIKLNYDLFWNKSTRDRNYNRFGGAGNPAPDYNYNPTGEGNFSQFTTHDYKYNPNGLPQYISESFSHILSFNHVLSPSTFYEIRVNKYNIDTKQYVYEDATQSVEYLVSVEEDSAQGIEAEVFDPFTPEGQAKLQALIAQGATWEYIVDPNGPDGYIDPGTFSGTPTSYSFMNKGVDVTHTTRSTAYWVAKADFTSQVNNNHQLKFGAEGRVHELTLHGFQIVPKTENGQTIEPFQPAVPEIGSIYRHDYNRKPRELSAYIQDKIELNKIIVNAGLRFDYFDANSVVPTDPTDPNIYSPFKNKNKYANWVDMPPDYPGTLDQYIQEKLAAGEIWEYTPDERRTFMHKKVDPKMAVSPRIGFAFPITARGVIHFSYGHFFQVPEFQYLYTNPDFKITSGSGTALFGNPDLEPQKTIMYEIGLQQQLADNLGVDITLFYRDVRDWVGTSPNISTEKTGVVYSQFENKDYSNVRGITLEIDKRLSHNYSFRANYTFQIAEGTYSNPQDAYNAGLRNQAPILALVPMNWDQTHTLNAQIIYDLSSWTFSLVGRYWSGRPYTPSFPVSETVGASAVSGLTTNSDRRPNQTGVDLRINKAFRFASKLYLQLFMDVYNLFDQRNETFIYTDTGTAEYTTTIDPSKIPYNAARVSTVEDFVLQPGWYSAPRQIQLGLRFGF